MAKIIIVEDEAIVAMATKMMLIKLSHEIISITSLAEEAITKVFENHVDLILMDIKLKGPMDGIQAALEIRKDKDTPIIFVTGNSDLKTKNRIAEVENSGILHKPIMLEDLRTALKKFLISEHGGK